MRRMMRSHWRRPQGVFFHRTNKMIAPTVPKNSAHQYPVTTSERNTDTCVNFGSSPPNCLKTPTNTGTRKPTRASITPTAKMITIVG